MHQRRHTGERGDLAGYERTVTLDPDPAIGVFRATPGRFPVNADWNCTLLWSDPLMMDRWGPSD